jgi:hypothetical protein
MDVEVYVQLSSSMITDLSRPGYRIFEKLELSIDMNSIAPTRRITKIYYASSMLESRCTILRGFPSFSKLGKMGRS